jgi:hypothetical protein
MGCSSGLSACLFPEERDRHGLAQDMSQGVKLLQGSDVGEQMPRTALIVK